jgi:TonB family protein
VSEQGLSLSVTVSFTLLPDGLIGAVALQQSSGYADVDAAVIDAIRRWHFTPAPGAGAAKGVIPYIIRAQ